MYLASLQCLPIPTIQHKTDTFPLIVHVPDVFREYDNTANLGYHPFHKLLQ